jgi:crotonobetainyl-CoA:carnitine CoA-transferase CaiB-like acyl-CoA transferase
MSTPLEGLKVLDLTRLLPGGFCSLMLADLGADVLKVEDTGAGDYMRWAPPYYEGLEASARSALFLALSRNKRSVQLDLKSESGREVLLRLVREHDVLVESFRPGVLERLGVGYERLREENRGLVYCAISGYGQDGPKRERAGHDMNYLGLVGLLGLTGEAGGPPVQSAGQIADIGAGALMAAIGILAALRERDGFPTRRAGAGQEEDARSRTGSGEGQFVDISMADGALSWLALVAGRYFADGVVPHRGDLELAGSLICYRPYECADGWMTLGALEPKFWRAWCEGTGRADLIEAQFQPPGSQAHLEVERIFRERTRAQWQEFAGAHDCCLEPVLELDEALESELARARGMVVEVAQPQTQPGEERGESPAHGDGAAGAHVGPAAGLPVRQLGIPLKLSRTPGEHARRPAPALGEHTYEVLGELGYTAREIAELARSGAVAGRGEETEATGSAATFRA